MVKHARLNMEGMRESTRLKVQAWLDYEAGFKMSYVEIPKDEFDIKRGQEQEKGLTEEVLRKARENGM